MQNLSIDAVVTILLYLIGVPVLLVQNSKDDVRYVLRHTLHWETFFFSITPVIFAILIVFIPMILAHVCGWYNQQTMTSDLILFFLILVSLAVSMIMPRYIRKRDIIDRLVQKTIRKVKTSGRLDNSILDALELLGMESDTGYERGLIISAMNRLSNAMVQRLDYSGSRLERLLEVLRNVLFGSDVLSSPDNFRSAVEVLRPIISTYYSKSKDNIWFSDADIDYSYLLLSEMGCQAIDFRVEGITSACIDGLEGANIPNSSASNGLWQIGAAAIEKNRIGQAREALHFLDAIVNSETDLCEHDEIVYDYLALLSAFWGHSAAGRREVLPQLNDLYERDRPVENPIISEEEMPRERLLARLVREAIQHHTKVGRFTIADSIDDMWSNYIIGLQN